MSEVRETKFKIFRYDPDKDKKPYMQDVTVGLESTDRMLLDALLKIKGTVDDSIAIRKSCREGVCGSDAMNINGKNGLACITNLNDLREPIVLKPLPGLPVIRDLIVDMTQFFKQYEFSSNMSSRNTTCSRICYLQINRKSEKSKEVQHFASDMPCLAKRMLQTCPPQENGSKSLCRIQLCQKLPECHYVENNLK